MEASKSASGRLTPANAPVPVGAGPAAVRFLGARFDLAPLERVRRQIAERSQGDPFAYVVTPNVDHVVRLARRDDLLPAYEGAWMSWCDSKPIAMLGRLFGLDLPHITGADLTGEIMRDMIRPGDRVALIAAHAGITGDLAARFPQAEFVEHVPPMGFIADAEAVAAALAFVSSHPARYLFIGIGAPQSEQFAAMIQAEGRATGTAFCTGAALEFVTGRKRRAPVWLQRLGMEWAFRAATEPRRLWKRYASAVLPLIGLALSELRQRLSAAGGGRSAGRER